nr:uncharacterized protein si:ch211-199g17.2 isoform X1 [Misgurnus anguillicaudatus]
MCTASSHAGCKSHLYNAMRSYLNSENRAQPIIGLNRITEMWTNNEPPVYFCDVCFLRILKTDIRNHIVGSLHRYNYIKSHHAHGWRSYTDLTLLARPLMDMAKTVEQREGTGDVQVLCVDDVIYKEMTSWPVPAAFGKLQRIRNQQDSNMIQSVVHNSPVKGNETAVQGLQELENSNKINSQSRASPKHPSTPPMSSKCSGVIEPLPKLSNPNRTSPSPKTLSPVRPLLQSQGASTHLNQMDCHVSSRMPNLESSLAPALIQHVNQDQTVIQDRYQIPQRWMMSSETQCLAETRSLHMSRTISLVRPPSQWSPIRIPSQNETVHPSEEESGVSHPFPISYGSHSLHLAQTADAYEAQLQTSSFTVNHMVPERTQDGTNKQEFFSDESFIHTTEPVGAVDLRVIKPIITQRALEPHGYNSFYDEIDFKEPFSIDFGAHAVEAQSHTSVEEKIPLPSRNTATQTQSPSSQIQSIEDTPKSCTKKNPLIGLQAVIKCQSVDGNPPPCCYLCQLCSMKLKKKNVFSHLTGLQHRQSYIEVFHPELLPNIKRECHNVDERLDDIAMQLEQQDGRGQIKVMRLSACLISEVLHRDYHWCMKVLNCGASVEPFNKWPEKNTAHSQVLKRPAESIKSSSLPTHLMPQKMKKVDPTNIISTKSVKNPVFKVSLSLQEGPVVIERDPLSVTATVAPEIENQSPKCTYKENEASLSLEINSPSEDQTCLHAWPPTVYNQEESWNTLEFPDGNALTQASIPSLTHPHTQVSHVDSRFFEVMSPVRYAYEGQYDHSQAIQVVEPSLRSVECDSLEEMPTYADCPVQDGFFCGNDWILQRQVTGPSANDHPEYMRNMWY